MKSTKKGNAFHAPCGVVCANFTSLGINIAARNLLDCRYELVSGYPMPDRSFIGGITIAFL